MQPLCHHITNRDQTAKNAQRIGWVCLSQFAYDLSDWRLNDWFMSSIKRTDRSIRNQMVFSSKAKSNNEGIPRMKKQFVSYLVAILILVFIMPTCLPRKIVNNQAQFIVNPYDISTLDIENVNKEVEDAKLNQARLLTLNQPTVNPYGYTAADTIDANNNLQVSQNTKTALKQMLDSNNFTKLGNYIPSQNQIDSGTEYWEDKKQDITLWLGSYWVPERTDAVSMDQQVWIDFCDHRISTLNVELELIDTILQNLSLDEKIIKKTTSETAKQIVNRKIALENHRINYFVDLKNVLIEGMKLNIVRKPDVGPFIPSHEQIVDGEIYWSAEKESVSTRQKPYWESERVQATQMNYQTWVDFCDSMIHNLDLRINLADSIIYNFLLDDKFITGTSVEDVKEIVVRKINLESQRISYYSDLAIVLNSGKNLIIPSYK